MINLDKIATEKRNPETTDLDLMSAREIADIMNRSDESITTAINNQIDEIGNVIELSAQSLKNGGRIFYIGAGTSGRLGVLDAAECRPTFGVDDNTVIGLIAGGEAAFLQAIEGAEDDTELAQKDLEEHNLNNKDIVIGIAASGRTPYVIGGLKYANSIGAKTASIAITDNSEIGEVAQQKIEVVVGPEVLTGSTRLKAGTAQKMILNMISTGAMVLNGKVYQNLMVDVQQSNLKLIERTKKIVMDATGVDYETAEKALDQSDYNAKLAIVILLNNTSKDEALNILDKQNGFIRERK